MSLIRVLPEAVANRIAAGEVVERPAAVVKELVENAVDSGATRIEITIRGAGRTELKISDNGCGMDREDLLLAFERHATSKIRNFEDLEALGTLGFRGEALPSIASVARVEVKTRTANDPTGWYLAMDAGRVVRIEETMCPVGTTFSVKNLFYNVPARRRFLKSNATEFGHIHVRFKRFALSRPQIGWKLINEDEVLYDFAPGSGEQRIGQLFGEKIIPDLRPIQWNNGAIKLNGWVGTAPLFRVQRGDQHLYLNDRAIRSPFITNSVIAGLGQIVEPGTFPFYILFIEMPPHQFDINVHPSKEEVKFDCEPDLRRAIVEGVRDALRSGGMTEPPHRFETPHADKSTVSDHYNRPEISRGGEPYTPPPTRERGFFDAPGGYIPKKYRNRPETQLPLTGWDADQTISEPATVSDETALRDLIEGVQRGEIPVWQMQGKYLIVQVPSGLVVIDQHVAHERILYEQAIRAMDAGGWPVQELLFPIDLELSPADVQTAEELQAELARIGFRIQSKNSTTIELHGVPQGVPIGNESAMVMQMLDLYKRDFEARPEQMDRLAATFACKAAVKAGMALEPAEIQQLIASLFRCDLPYACPHGRPVLIQMTIDELDRRFGRSGG